MATYLKPEVRKEQILTAAIEVAERDGYMHMRRSDVADVAGCATGSVSRYFNTMHQLRRAVMREAVKSSNHRIVAQGLVANDNQAMKAPEEVKQAALSAVMG